MPPDIGHVANAFCVVGIMLGLPSAVGVVFSLLFGMRLMRATPKNAAGMPVSNPDAVILAIYGIARVVGAVAGVVGAIGKIAAIALLLLSMLALGLATLMYFTGQGLNDHEPWARETAAMISGGFLALSLFALVALRGWRRVLPLSTGVAAVYGLVALWHGY